MAVQTELRSRLRSQLDDRRLRLRDAIADVGEEADLVHLLKAVDGALKRLETRNFQACEICKEDVEEEWLLAHPLIQYCLCSLSEAQQRALEHDLELASRIQWSLLPRQDLRVAGWEIHYRYLPAGPVGGDYCDVVPAAAGAQDSVFFLLGDVSGHGVAASLLMARLSALFRGGIETGLDVKDLVSRVNGQVVASTLASQYATVVCGRAGSDGEVAVCNAGHCPPLLVTDTGVSPVESSGLPVGLFAAAPYAVHRVALAPGDTLFLYTDGLTEARVGEGEEYGVERLSRVLRQHRGQSLHGLGAACLEDVRAYVAGGPVSDDLTLMAVRRAGAWEARSR